jgi:hypothetical protein
VTDRTPREPVNGGPPAHEQDVPYQSLMKVYLAERVAIERSRRRRGAKV